MKVTSPTIYWLSKQSRVLSLDFHPFTNEFVIAGSQRVYYDDTEKKGDSDLLAGCIKFWQIGENPGLPKFKYGVPQAQSTVNIVKYSPDGRYVASGSDNKFITIWTIKNTNKSICSNQKMRRWAPCFQLGGHTQDVVDLCWSKDSKFLVSSGMDGRTHFYHVQTQTSKFTTGQNGKFIQGVALDPLCRYYVSMSNDQNAKVMIKIKSNDKKQSERAPVSYNSYNLKQYTYNNNDNSNKDDQESQMVEELTKRDSKFNMFANESVTTFFRRPSISPDGQLFLLPCGIWKNTPTDTPICCSYLFRRNYYEKPSFAVQSNGQPVLVCRFCPKLFKKQNPEQGLFKQQYYMVFALATTHSVLVYSTKDMKPLHGIGNYHFAALTDLSWRNDEVLAVCSSDGFVTFVNFQKGMLGQQYIPDDGPLKDLVTRMPYIPPQKKQKIDQKPEPVQQQRIEYRQTAQGVKKKIIPKIVKEDD